MPAKGRKVASRQAQLGRRRRQRRNAGQPAAVADQQEDYSANGSAVAIPEPTTVGSQPAPAEAAVAPAAPPRTVAPARAVSQQATDRSMAYTHLGRELRRILILAGALLVALLALAFFL